MSLQRRKGLKRDGPGARRFAGSRVEMKSDLEKTSAFVQRGRVSGSASLQASARKGAAAERAKRATEGPLSPREWRERAFESSEGRCMISGARARHAFDRLFHVHHPLPKDELRARELRGVVWDPRNAMWLAATVHFEHEHGVVQIPRGKVPASVWEFCAELDRQGGQGDGPEWATALVERLHP